MIWREAIEAARKRGYFGERDYVLWGDHWTCPAAEVYRRVTGARVLNATIRGPRSPWAELWNIGDTMLKALNRSDFDLAHRIVDAIEDKALELKREVVT